MTEATVVVITADARLGGVLSAQAALCGMQSAVFADIASVPQTLWQKDCVAVINLDEKRGTPLPEQVRVLPISERLLDKATAFLGASSLCKSDSRNQRVKSTWKSFMSCCWVLSSSSIAQRP